MRETCTSGSVRGEGGNLLTYSARKGWVSVDDDRERRRCGTFCFCYDSEGTGERFELCPSATPT
jgi:hypothetical protein